MSPRFLLIAFVFCALPCVSPSQVTKTGTSYLFRMKLVKGSVYSFDVTSSTEMGTGKPMVMPMSYSMKVLSVTKGIADVAMTSTSPMQKAPQTMNVKMDSRGAVEGQSGLEQLTGVRLPEKAIKVGGTWKGTQKVAMFAQSMTVDSVYTFTGVQALGKVQCAVLSVKSTGKGSIASTTTGKMYIELANGMLYQSNLTSSITLTQGSKPQTFKSTATIKRK